MGKQETASLVELIDARIRVDAEIDRLEEEKKAMVGPIVTALKAVGLKKAFGSEGTGYRLQERLDCEYGEDAYSYVLRNGLNPVFTPPPKITRSKVFDAHKKTLLTLAQFDRLQKCAGELQTIQTLVTIQEKPDAGKEGTADD